ncbi:MAG: hypothetical protein D6698_05080 [Gammaproteobacteria bacterium]|nr:MAG: hypothetical protein D6698_05080 [Gammaproteobacteria bacterium]
MIASCFSLVCFAAAIVVGIHVGNTPQTVLLRAVLVMIICWPIGYLVGLVAQRAIMDQINRYKQEHPIPDESSVES